MSRFSEEILDIPKSKLCKYIAGEEHNARHKKRLQKAIICLPKFKIWCHNNGFIFSTNGTENTSWRISYKNRKVIWVPSTADFKFGHPQDKLHLHDVVQVMYVLIKWKKLVDLDIKYYDGWWKNTQFKENNNDITVS